jgi:hypothetical protein
MLLELIGFPLQRSFSRTRFSCPLRCVFLEKDYRS